MTRPDIHGAIVRSLTDTQRERLRGIDLTNIANAIISDLGLREESECGKFHGDAVAMGLKPAVRYVTDWSTDAWADTSRQAITEATRPPTIGERLYPIPDRCPQMHSRIYPGPIAAQIASITKSRVPQAGQPADERNHQ